MNRVEHQLQITAEWITYYAQSIEAPLQIINGKLLAPSTMPIIFWKEFHIPWLDLKAPLIHGSQHFFYESPIMADMTLKCELSLTKIEKKTGRQGEMTFYTHTLVCLCDGEFIVRAETLLIAIGDEA